MGRTCQVPSVTGECKMLYRGVHVLANNSNQFIWQYRNNTNDAITAPGEDRVFINFDQGVYRVGVTRVSVCYVSPTSIVPDAQNSSGRTCDYFLAFLQHYKRHELVLLIVRLLNKLSSTKVYTRQCAVPTGGQQLLCLLGHPEVATEVLVNLVEGIHTTLLTQVPNFHGTVIITAGNRGRVQICNRIYSSRVSAVQPPYLLSCVAVSCDYRHIQGGANENSAIRRELDGTAGVVMRFQGFHFICSLSILKNLDRTRDQGSSEHIS
mmetsp:Transcript_43090/g.52257  ORF Transcript_43090/g.52257 Transcript_43090/m.52257 type:complete len:265 (-) Transcript_43090:145-939(-)